MENGSSWQQEDCEEAAAVVQVGGDGGLDVTACRGTRKRKEMLN